MIRVLFNKLIKNKSKKVFKCNRNKIYNIFFYLCVIDLNNYYRCIWLLRNFFVCNILVFVCDVDCKIYIYIFLNMVLILMDILL